MAAGNEIRVKDVTPTIDAFRTGDKLLIDGPYGTVNMSKDTLLQLTAENVRVFFENNPEYVYAVTDSKGAFLFGVKKDGSFEWQKGIPTLTKEYILAGLSTKVDKVTGKSLIDAVYASCVSIETNPEYVYVVTDNDGAFLFGVKKDGSFEWQKGIPTPLKEEILAGLSTKEDKVTGKSLIDEVYASCASSNDNQEYLKTLLDKKGNILYGVLNNGKIRIYSDVELRGDVKLGEKASDSVIDSLVKNKPGILSNDYSECASAKLEVPYFATLNIRGTTKIPHTKSLSLPVVVEFTDCRGNYFKKNARIAAQGNSSLAFPKKNISLDLMNDAWIGDDTFKVKFGDWVSQDSFHMKAYYTDFFRCLGAAMYELFDLIVSTRGCGEDAAWKLAEKDNYKSIGGSVNDRIDTGAKCHPLGFPVQVLLEGEFYGIYMWQLKKHRDNYKMDKDEPTNIHLDGQINTNSLWGGTIDWTSFEIRNPKNLYCEDGSKYDGDAPTEIAGSETVATWIQNGQLPDGTAITSKIRKNLERTATVKDYIVSLSSRVGQVQNAQDKKEEFDKYFNVDNIIDYIVFTDIVRDSDAYDKNWQWLTYDGTKWFVAPYDLDCTLGANWDGTIVRNPSANGHINPSTDLPTGLVYLINDYSSLLESRYAALRQSVLTPNAIKKIVQDWVVRIGPEIYKKEFEKWPDTPSNNDFVVNADYWEQVFDASGIPVMGTEKTYSSTATYAQGDEVFFGYDATNGFFKFKAVQSTTGNAPITQYRYKDSMTRVFDWIDKRFACVDLAYNFN